MNGRYYDRPSASGLVAMTLCIGVTSLVAIYGHLVNGVYAKQLPPVELQPIVRVAMPTATPTIQQAQKKPQAITKTVIAHEAKPNPGYDVEAIDAYIRQVFGADADDAMRILTCENRAHNPKATNHNRNGSIDRGVFQINSIHDRTHGQDMFDYKANIDYAYRIFARQGWSPWSCSHVLGIKSFWQ
jgi:hypothetical protein